MSIESQSRVFRVGTSAPARYQLSVAALTATLGVAAASWSSRCGR
jgi:hypothetical protein